MRRADRLFQIVQLLKSRRLTTAADLASELEVSTRTVYRDVQDLLESGVPIEGEAGVGYRLAKGYELKPMTFTVDEIEALVLGARLVQAWADPDLGDAVRAAMRKIEAVLPEPLQASMLQTALFGPPHRMKYEASVQLRQLRKCIGNDRWVQMDYVDAVGAPTARVVVPLALYFWGQQWLLAAYCCLRNAYRSFRVDRIQSMSDVPQKPELLPAEESINLENYIRAMEANAASSMQRAPAPLSVT